MRQLTPIWLALVLLPTPSLAQKQPLAEKPSQGLVNERPDGGVGLNYQGGVAGYSGPIRDGNAIATDVTSPEQRKANAEAEIARRKAAVEQERAISAERQRAIQRSRAEQEGAIVEDEEKAIQQSRARRTQRTRESGMSSGETNSGDLIMACGAKGFAADFATGNCVSPQGRQTNPMNLYPPFAAPLPKPKPDDLIKRCGAMGRGADFTTGRCM